MQRQPSASCWPPSAERKAGKSRLVSGVFCAAFAVFSEGNLTREDLMMMTKATPYVMLAAAAAVLLNWTQDFSMSSTLWPYIDALSVAACILGVLAFWNDTETGCKVVGALFGVLGAAVVIQFIVVGVADSIVWEVIDFFLVMGLTLGAGLLLSHRT